MKTFDWIVGNLVRLTAMVWAIMAVPAFLGGIFDPGDASRLALMLLLPLVALEIGVFVAAAGFPGAVPYLIVLRLLPRGDSAASRSGSSR